MNVSMLPLRMVLTAAAVREIQTRETHTDVWKINWQN